MDQITRRLLSRGASQGVLSREAIDAALELTGLRPGRAEWREFAAMRLAGMLSLAAGLVFLIAFNLVRARFGRRWHCFWCC
jgi:hypothetical protein